jgi:translation initiation factor 5A
MSGSDDDNYEVGRVDTGALESTSIPVNKLRKGGYVMLEGRPCRVVDITKSKTGKHGHAKAGIAGSDLFTGRRYEAHLPTSHDIEVPLVERQDYQLINIDGKATQLLDLQGNMREDVEIGEGEVDERIQAMFDSGEAEEIIVTVLSSNGESRFVENRADALEAAETAHCHRRMELDYYDQLKMMEERHAKEEEEMERKHNLRRGEWQAARDFEVGVAAQKVENLKKEMEEMKDEEKVWALYHRTETDPFVLRGCVAGKRVLDLARINTLALPPLRASIVAKKTIKRFNRIRAA